MKNSLKFLLFTILSFIIISCNRDDDKTMLGEPGTSALSASVSSLVLSKENADKNAITFSWTSPTYPANVMVYNSLQISLKGTNFANPQTVTLEQGTKSLTFTVQDLNTMLRKMNLPFTSPSDVEVRLASTIGNVSLGTNVAPVYSAVVPLKVTPYALVSYVYVPGAYQGWDPGTAVQLVSAMGNGIHTGYVSFPAAGSEFKITPNRNWDVSYGSDNGSTLSTTAGNIKSVGAGSYMLTVDMNKLTITMVPYGFGIIGSATPNGWDTPDTKMVWNSTTAMWETTLVLTAGEIKFRLNDAWDVNYGGSGGNAVAGGDNIKISAAGTYKVTLDVDNLKYTLTKQ